MKAEDLKGVEGNTKGDKNSAIELSNRLVSSLEKVIKGKRDVLKLVITALLADGHVLLEDYPGSGKTTLCKALGRLIDSSGGNKDPNIIPFRRIQFTPDMLPGDILGVNVFEPKTGEFKFVHGPVFAHIVLADEINRAGPKVQAAFLECMAEKQVTIDNVTHRLDDLFFVLGTQNPLDIAGTYPLPLVQLDRFLIKIPMSYVDKDTEYEILKGYKEIETNLEGLEPVCTRDEVLLARKACDDVSISDVIINAIVKIAQRTRKDSAFEFGISTRGALMLQKALRAYAIVEGRDYVTEDDLKFLSPFVLLHRLKTKGIDDTDRKALEGLLLPVLEEAVRSF